MHPLHCKLNFPALIVNKVVEVLQAHASVSDVTLYLRETFFEATHNVYVGMVVAGIITLSILSLTPARFPTLQEKE